MRIPLPHDVHDSTRSLTTRDIGHCLWGYVRAFRSLNNLFAFGYHMKDKELNDMTIRVWSIGLLHVVCVWYRDSKERLRPECRNVSDDAGSLSTCCNGRVHAVTA
jgi:hypothetical protein